MLCYISDIAVYLLYVLFCGRLPRLGYYLAGGRDFGWHLSVRLCAPVCDLRLINPGSTANWRYLVPSSTQPVICLRLEDTISRPVLLYKPLNDVATRLLWWCGRGTCGRTPERRKRRAAWRSKGAGAAGSDKRRRVTRRTSWRVVELAYSAAYAQPSPLCVASGNERVSLRRRTGRRVCGRGLSASHGIRICYSPLRTVAYLRSSRAAWNGFSQPPLRSSLSLAWWRMLPAAQSPCWRLNAEWWTLATQRKTCGFLPGDISQSGVPSS